MQHATQAEFEVWYEENIGDENKPVREAAFSAWEASRRASTAPVPHGWKLVPIELLERIQESLGSFISDQGWSQSDMDTADALDGVLAAAPRPPEAAPVKFPEPFTTLVRKNSWSPNSYEAAPRSNHQDYGRQWADERINVFTEQQVRDLLAAHGIQEQST